MTEGMILNISRYCTHDGPGIRTTIFLKGCPLRCVWCHNPESQSMYPELSLDRAKCVSCGRCSEICPQKCINTAHRFERSDCTGCGACADLCAAGALTLYGERVFAEELLPRLLRDRPFFEASGGGVTVSGGEPLMQPDFTGAILSALRAEKIHTALETCGFASEKVFGQIAGLCNLILFDIKESDPERHLRYTGVPPEPILKNLYLADEMGIPVLLRAPIVPTLNDRSEYIEALSRIAKSLRHCIGLEIMPYHTIGAYKYAQLDRPYPCEKIPEPGEAQKLEWNRLSQIRN